MAHTDLGTRVAGTWLAIASPLLAAALIGHGPIDPDMGRQMEMVANAPVRWTVVHWASAAALSLLALAGLIVLAARSRLTDTPLAMSAWGVVTIGSVWTMTTAVAEATVVSAAAAAGDFTTFEAWWAFSEGKATGVMFVALAIAAIAAKEARNGQTTPPWAAYIAVVAGIASFLGWAIGMWFEVAMGSLVWLVASVVMLLWMLWFGLKLTQAN